MKKLALIIIGISLIFISCKKELDTPELKPFPSGETLTVGNLLEKIEQNGEYQFDSVKDASVEGWVIADEKSGNIYRTFYLRDNTGAIAVYRPSGSDDFNARTGDLVQISLKGAILGSYNGLPQIQLQEEKTNKLICIKQRDGVINPTVTTLAAVTQGKHLCDLVKIDGVEFSDPEGHTYAENDANTNHGIEDCDGYSCIVRTSNYATFANDSLPKGKGSLICIVSVYRTDWQLLIRNTSDVSMDGPRCGQIGGQPQEMPYEQSFATSFGTYSTYDVSGEQSWGIDFSTAKMTGFVDQVNYANEDWLISSPVNVMNVSHAKLSMSYIARYFSNLNHDVTLQVSTDYVFESDPTTATWEPLDVELTESTNWDDFMTTEVSLDKYIGQQIWVAVKYLSTDSKAGTIEVQSINIEEGQAGGGEGGEVQEMPYYQDFSASFGTFCTYDIDGAESWGIDFHTAKMTGHVTVGDNQYEEHANEDWLISSPVSLSGDGIVLCINYIARYFNNLNEDITVWMSTDYTFNDNPYNATWTKLPATFVSGSDWNTFYNAEVDLSSHAGKTATFAVKYLSTNEKAGTIEIKHISVENGGITPPAPEAIFSETFASGQGDFEIVDVNLGGSLTYVWKYNSQYSCMKASAYANNTNNESESWIVSPAIDMSAVGSAFLSFYHAYKFGANHEEEMTVWATASYTGDVTTTDWVKLEIPIYPAGTNWTFVNSGVIDMREFAGEREVVIGFRYESSSTAAATWEVKNILIEE